MLEKHLKLLLFAAFLFSAYALSTFSQSVKEESAKDGLEIIPARVERVRKNVITVTFDDNQKSNLVLKRGESASVGEIVRYQRKYLQANQY